MSILNKIRDYYNSLELSKKSVEWIREHRWSLIVTIIFFSVWGLVLILNVRSIDSILIEIRALEKQSHEIDNINDRYLYEIVNLQSAERIINIAEEQLNMEQSQKAPDILK